ncbi:TPA: toxin-antitoxin system TumE family protein [Legionella pneumophila]
MKQDVGLETLLALNGTEYTEENGYWYKIEAFLVEPTEERPHGIRYNLTLHDNYNQRILGFDNAHGIKVKESGRYSGRIIMYDHVHTSINDKGTPYEFESAEQLLRDFFQEVNSIIQKLNNGDKK